MSRGSVTVVSVDALSYSGTTWLNLVLGSHPDAFTLGPPDRVWSLRDKGFEGANRIWGEQDTFWRGFDSSWDRKENFLVALGRYRGASHIIFDNPSPEFRRAVMDHPDVVVKPMQYLRDARAITASYVRKFPQTSYLDSILPGGWFYASFMAMKLPEDRSRFPVFYYEDCQRDPLGFLARVGPYLGLSYTDKALRFWEWDHHITAGNGGTIWLVKMAKGLEPTGFKDAQFYGERLEALKRNPIGAFVDERWKTELGRLERFYFDVVLGAKHQELGFERDRFSDEEVRCLLDQHDFLVAAGLRRPLPSGLVTGHRVKKMIGLPDGLKRVHAGARARLSRLGSLTLSDARALVSARVPAFRRRRSAAEPQPARYPVPPEGTHYFDEILPGMRESFSRYTVRASGWRLKDVAGEINRRVYYAHGPDYAHASPYRILADTPSRYAQLLESILKLEGCRFLPARDVADTRPSSSEIICHVRHDVDIDIVAALQQAEIEASLGISTTYYILHTAPYYGYWDGRVFKRHEATAEIYLRIQELGHEIGLHTDGLNLYEFYQVDGAEGVRQELEWLRSRGLKIEGTAAHNSVGVYGAENFALFKGQPLSLTDMARPLVVAHNGNLALLQQLDPHSLGLKYEGNEVFRNDVVVHYYALRSMNEWRYVLRGGEFGPRGTGESWFAQEKVVDHLSSVARGTYAFLIVHPVYYGLRPDPGSTPATGRARPAPYGDGMRTAWRRSPGAISLRTTPAGGKIDYQSVTKINELGFADVPYAYIAKLDRRVAFLGKDQLATDRISVECKAHHALARKLRRRNALRVGAMALSARAAPLSVRLQWFRLMQGARAFTEVVLSVGLSDAVVEDKDLLSEVFGVPEWALASLLPATFDEAIGGPSESGSFGKLEADRTRAQEFWSKLLHSVSTGKVADEVLERLSARLERAISILKTYRVPVTLLLEDCGEPAGLPWLELSSAQRGELARWAGEWVRGLARRCEVDFADPYAEFVSYTGRSSTHWPADGLWSIHGHTLAGHALAEAFTLRESGM